MVITHGLSPGYIRSTLNATHYTPRQRGTSKLMHISASCLNLTSPCSDMYMAAREYAKALDIMGENGWVDRSVCQIPTSICYFERETSTVSNTCTYTDCRLLGLVHELDKSQTEMLSKCAHYLKKLGQVCSVCRSPCVLVCVLVCGVCVCVCVCVMCVRVSVCCKCVCVCMCVCDVCACECVLCVLCV